MKYKTFLRSYKADPARPEVKNNFLRGRKITDSTGLTLDEALARCKLYNNNRNARQIRKGTMMEFQREE